MTTCSSLAEVRAAARADHDTHGEPLTQDQADLVAAILTAATQTQAA